MSVKRKSFLFITVFIVFSNLFQNAVYAKNTPVPQQSKPKTEIKSQSSKNTTKTNSDSKNKVPWKISYRTKISFPCGLVAFYNDKYALIVGPDNDLHYSNDGGKTWPKSNFAATERLGLDIVNEKISYTSGLFNLMMKTTDGGKNWVELPKSNMVGKILSFVDENKGFITGGYELERTKDGAKSWESLRIPDGIGEISAMSFNSENQGYLLDCHGSLYVTGDGCKTWTKYTIFKNATILTGNKNQTCALGFSDKLHGTVVCSMEDGNTFAYVTQDGGKSWKQEKLPPEIKSDFGFAIYLSRDKKAFTLLDLMAGNVYVIKHQ